MKKEKERQEIHVTYDVIGILVQRYHELGYIIILEIMLVMYS